jgi:hypothetical protein
LRVCGYIYKLQSYSTYVFPHILCFRTVYVRLSAQIPKWDFEDVFELLHCLEQEIKVYDLADSVLEEDKEPKPEPKERIMTA